MKKIIASAGLVAVGAAGLQAQNYGDLTPEQASKRWSVSAAVRGFYDDNYTTRPSGPLKADSFGFEFSPSAMVNLPMETSYFGLAYIYSLRYFEDRDDDKFDQSHDVRLNFDHRFTERYRVNLRDQFVYSIEPTLLSQQGTVTAPTTLRANAEGLHNNALLTFDAELTRLWSLRVSYGNNFYDYQDSGDGSYSALLDRDEHAVRIDPRYIVSPSTTAFAGYEFGYSDYLSSDFIGPGVQGSDRSERSHAFYVGAEHHFTPELSVEGRAGAKFRDYFKLDQDKLGPYVDLTGSYTYLPGSTIKVGVKYDNNATDVAFVGTDPDDVTLDQDTTTGYVSVNHRITAFLTAGLLAQYQHSVYNGGPTDGDTDDYITMGVNVAYKVHKNWSVEATYYLDNLWSDIDGREFNRNRVFAGVRGTY
jgi:hypothetical protein